MASYVVSIHSAENRESADGQAATHASGSAEATTSTADGQAATHASSFIEWPRCHSFSTPWPRLNIVTDDDALQVKAVLHGLHDARPASAN